MASYTVIERLGNGSHGTVYIGDYTHKPITTRVAIKKIYLSKKVTNWRYF